MQSNPHNLTVIDGETLIFFLPTVPQVSQVTLFLLLSYLPSLSSLAFLRKRLENERFYCEFRLCITTADIGSRKGIGLCPYPYAVGVSSFACKRNFTAATAAISRCRKATFHIPLAE